MQNCIQNKYVQYCVRPQRIKEEYRKGRLFSFNFNAAGSCIHSVNCAVRYTFSHSYCTIPISHHQPASMS
jgi:hypothetical protein